MFSCFSKKSPPINKRVINLEFNNDGSFIEQANFDFNRAIEEKRSYVKSFSFNSSWKLDNVVYINSDGTRLLSHILMRDNIWKNAKLDYSSEYVGAKVNNRWYFMLGTSIVFQRSAFKYDESTPLTFEELSYLVNRKLYDSITTEKNGKIITKESFFAAKLKELDAGVPGSDSLFLKKANEWMNYPPMAQEEIDKINKSIAESKPLIPTKRFFWQKHFGKKKLFDSDAWKNRNKN